jgi:hypothetical protein
MDFKNAWSSEPEAEGGSFETIPEGSYVGAIDNVTLDMTKAPNRVTVIYKITRGEMAGRKLFGNYRLEGKGIGFLKKDLKQLGVEYKDISDPTQIIRRVTPLIGSACELAVKHREYEGKTYESVYLNRLIGAAAPDDTNYSASEIPF